LERDEGARPEPGPLACTVRAFDDQKRKRQT
jgi:hypothetical protein